MAKSSKKSKEAKAPESPSPAPGMESSNGHGPAESARPSPAKKKAVKAAAPAKAASKSRSIAVKKTSTPRKPRAKKTAGRASKTIVTDEEIRIRAYFISEWRTQNGMLGDSARDWLEARRQLQAEAALA